MGFGHGHGGRNLWSEGTEPPGWVTSLYVAESTGCRGIKNEVLGEVALIHFSLFDRGMHAHVPQHSMGLRGHALGAAWCMSCHDVIDFYEGRVPFPAPGGG